MTREEIKNKLFDIILKNSSPTMVVKRIIDYQQTMVIVEELINHETDLLKEFVEWLTNKFEEEYELKLNDCVELESDNNYDGPIPYMEVVAYNRGELSGIELMKWYFTDYYTVEKFLEERK